MKIAKALFALIAASAMLNAAHSAFAADVVNPGDPIIVSTMNDTEGEIFGKMMVLALRDAGYEVTDNTYGFTGTVNGRTALLHGETDIYMDYTGRGLRLIEGVDKDLYRNMETAWKSVSDWDKETNHLIWMRYAPFNNTDCIAVTREFSEKNNVKSIADLARFVSEGGKVKISLHNYWVTLATGMPGMEKEYGLKLDDMQYIVDLANPEQILAQGTDGVNAAHLYSSSGLIREFDLVVLDDPKHVSPIYSPCPIIREGRLQKYPGISAVLDKVFESITLEEQLVMNAKVQAEGLSGEEVAREYLLSKGLISK